VEGVHPSIECYRQIAVKLDDELASDAKFTNPPKALAWNAKLPRQDLSLTRQPWIDGCSAALPRVDIPTSLGAPGSSRGAAAARSGGRGHRGNIGQRGGGNPPTRITHRDRLKVQYLIVLS
jgi:hypothetical protein